MTQQFIECQLEEVKVSISVKPSVRISFIVSMKRLDTDSNICHFFQIGFGSEPVLRSSQFNSLWLSGPDFVASFETRRFVYFLFRETAIEAMNCGKAVYSRIARICKNDDGYDYLKVKNSRYIYQAHFHFSVLYNVILHSISKRF